MRNPDTTNLFRKEIDLKNAVPLPPELKQLPSIKAEPWLLVDKDASIFLEGPAFDRQGNLFVSSIFDSRILKINPKKKVEVIFQQQGLLPDGIAIHKDGRLFVACLSGKVITIQPDGSDLRQVEPRFNGKPASVNDLVFDRDGNLYVTDFIGTVAEPTGGVYRFSADVTRIERVIDHLASANGIGLSPEGNVLWVSETGRNELLRIELLEDGIGINPIAGVTIPCRFSGGPGGCDSMAIDVEGNIYQCMIFQGRAVVLNNRGIPVANVVIPGREKGKHLGTANVAFKPGSDRAFITAWGEGGAWIYTFRGLAKGAGALLTPVTCKTSRAVPVTGSAAKLFFLRAPHARQPEFVLPPERMRGEQNPVSIQLAICDPKSWET